MKTVKLKCECCEKQKPIEVTNKDFSDIGMGKMKYSDIKYLTYFEKILVNDKMCDTCYDEELFSNLDLEFPF